MSLSALALSGCTIKLIGSINNTTTSSVSSCATAASVTVAAVYPTNGANWMSYVRNNNGGTNTYDQPDTSCDSGWGSGCIHGGEKKKVITTETSCNGLTGADSLGVFDWECAVTSGFATFYSIGLKSGKGLGDLIQSAAAGFKSIQFSVTKSGCTAFQSTASTTWWTNTISAPPANGLAGDSAVALTGAGTIYVVDSATATQGYNINSNRVALVTLPGITLTYGGKNQNNTNTATNELDTATGTSINLVGAGTQDFLWVEGNFNSVPAAGTTANQAVFLKSGYCHRVHLVTIKGSDGNQLSFNSITHSEVTSLKLANGGNASSYCLNLFSSSYNRFYDVSVGNCAYRGIYLSNSSNNNFAKISSFNNTSEGIYISGTSANNFFINIITANNGNTGIRLATTGAGNTFQMLTTVGSNSAGILNISTNSTYVHQVLSVNNAGPGIFFNASDNGFLGQIATSNNTGAGLNLNATADNNTYKSGTMLSVDVANCSVLGAGNNIQDTTCNFGAGFAETPTVASISTTTLVGQVGSPGDSVNADDTNGVGTYNTMTDWSNFENIFRTWGKYAAFTFPDSNLTSRCAAGGSCQMYDFRLKTGGASSIVSVNGTFANGAACPASADGTTAASYYTDVNARKVLLNAFEIVGDGIGDEDGFCSSNEACIFAPHIGAYQGEGSYSSTSCVYTGTQVTGVTLYRYSTIAQ